MRNTENIHPSGTKEAISQQCLGDSPDAALPCGYGTVPGAPTGITQLKTPSNRGHKPGGMTSQTECSEINGGAGSIQRNIFSMFSQAKLATLLNTQSQRSILKEPGSGGVVDCFLQLWI